MYIFNILYTHATSCDKHHHMLVCLKGLHANMMDWVPECAPLWSFKYLACCIWPHMSWLLHMFTSIMILKLAIFFYHVVNWINIPRLHNGHVQYPRIVVLCMLHTRGSGSTSYRDSGNTSYVMHTNLTFSGRFYIFDIMFSGSNHQQHFKLLCYSSNGHPQWRVRAILRSFGAGTSRCQHRTGAERGYNRWESTRVGSLPYSYLREGLDARERQRECGPGQGEYVWRGRRSPEVAVWTSSEWANLKHSEGVHHCPLYQARVSKGLEVCLAHRQLQCHARVSKGLVMMCSMVGSTLA